MQWIWNTWALFLNNLTHVALDSNRLSGTIPASIFNLSSIRALRISYNQLEATLPSDIGITLPNLQTLGLSASQFTGSVPSDRGITLPSIRSVYAITASNGHEISYAAYCPEQHPSPPSEFLAGMGDVFSISWMEYKCGANDRCIHQSLLMEYYS